ncbi:MAG: branched-chain amino acid ABC transporter permease, partial [Candidatus Bathyarchaeia archaeon]
LTMIAMHLFLKRSLLGKAFRAVAANRDCARLSGIPADRMVMLSFIFSGGLGAMGGILITPITTTSFNSGVMLGLKGFSAAILGGYGSMPGAVSGGLILGVLESMSAGVISSKFKDAVSFFVLLLILFFRPNGLFGMGHIKRV